MSAWPSTITDRMQFERGARASFPGLRGRRVRRSASVTFRYTLEMDVPFYEARQVTIDFLVSSGVPRVYVDGPTSSPHRYDDGSLCMWYPGDAANHRWTFEHGLLDLLDTIRGHLFREAYWREHGERDDAWLGPEVAHGPVAQEEPAR